MKRLYCLLPDLQEQRLSLISKSVHCLFNFFPNNVPTQASLSQAWLLSTCTMNLPTIFYYSISKNLCKRASSYFTAFQRALVFFTNPQRMLLLIAIQLLGRHNLLICSTLRNATMSWTFVEAFPHLVCLKTHSQGMNSYHPLVLKSSLVQLKPR